VSIFSRRRKAAREQGPEGDATVADDLDADLDDPGDESDVTVDDEPVEEAERDPLTGPFDITEVDGPEGRIDLGSLWLTGVEGLELRLEMDQATSSVIAATLVLGESAAQLQAFAAPRSSGIWREIRREIAASISGQGGTADEVDGPLGTELRVRMPSAGPDGRTVFAPARFLGVDGPRWFLRVVLSGRAAIDEGEAATLLDVVKQTVVVRGQEPMAPREMLPLGLPSDETPVLPEPESPSLNPFERGPEITEVR